MDNAPPIDHGLRRYAVLHHSGVELPHFDLLFETADDSPLIAFRVEHWPLVDQPATRLRDHRRLYLSYEGPIAGDRGQVIRVADGQLQVLRTPIGWRLQHPDGRLFATLQPRTSGTATDQWQLMTSQIA